MKKEKALFMELVRMALGNCKTLPHPPSEEEWCGIFEESQRQGLAAFLIPAIDKLSNDGFRPPMDILYEWIEIGELTARMNKIVNSQCVELSKLFADAGFRSCILKGQGNALMYDNPLTRATGDIDIWIDADRETVKSFVLERFPNAKESYLHIDFPVFDDVPVEVHYRPTIARSHKYNLRLQSFYDSLACECFLNKVPVENGAFRIPVPELNVVMQMSHIMGHFFEEGIGLRQVVDLYYLLRKTGFDRPKMGKKLRDLGMGRFSRAMMWILHYELGLDEKFLIAEPDKRRGRLLIEEIMTGGNFGRFDKRQDKRLYSRSPLLYKIKRNTRYVWLFPMESFLSPFMAKMRRCI